MTTRLDRLLAREPFVVLDGGLATELAARGHDLDDPLWSARLLLDDPDAIARVHEDYFRAGADVAITASYQASLSGLRARGLDDAQAHAVLRRSVELATRARDAFAPDTKLVVASLGSYGATLANGAEYSGAFGDIDDDALVAFHRERIDILAPGSDLLAFETIPSHFEAEAIARALAGADFPGAWVSFTCRDATTS
ncbi:MAG TPA: homocysteine S-methyltransferase, partial [Nannocystaceae bacterium]|nr:homocysteine S-methyltransferase [Nannocystaceae bacterium]